MLVNNLYYFIVICDKFLLFYVPCPFKLWTIMTLHIFRSVLAVSKVYLFSIPPSLCYTFHLHKFVRYVTCCIFYCIFCLSCIQHVLRVSNFLYVLSTFSSVPEMSAFFLNIKANFLFVSNFLQNFLVAHIFLFTFF